MLRRGAHEEPPWRGPCSRSSADQAVEAPAADCNHTKTDFRGVCVVCKYDQAPTEVSAMRAFDCLDARLKR